MEKEKPKGTKIDFPAFHHEGTSPGKAKVLLQDERKLEPAMRGVVSVTINTLKQSTG